MRQDRRANVLVVEDDTLVRDMIVDILRDAGFGALEAGCASEGLRVLAEHPVDAVITDVDLPGELDGMGLAQRIGEFWPKIGVIIMSGRLAGPLPPQTQFLAKPFAAERLLRSVADLIDERLFAAS